MTLDDRIKKDLDELYNGGNTPGVIKDALGLDGLTQSEYGQTSFATKALPGYYTGDRKAKTVIVMLNPGVGVYEANSNLMCDIMKHGMKNAADIDNYHKWCIDYGHIDKMRQDHFDLKQAFFLHHWKDTGVSLPENLSAKPQSDMQTLLDAKEAVLTQKLQLELIPYASSSFSGFNKDKIESVIPFVETLFDEIASHERKYVIFCSRLFKTLFEEYNKIHSKTIEFIADKQEQIHGSKMKGTCSVIAIHHQEQTFKAIVANTFSNRALSNAYDLMEKYGDYCYKQFITCFNSSPSNP